MYGKNKSRKSRKILLAPWLKMIIMFLKKLQYYTIVIPFRYRTEQKPSAAHFSSAFQQLIKN